jgi:hypothetical protein
VRIKARNAEHVHTMAADAFVADDIADDSAMAGAVP